MSKQPSLHVKYHPASNVLVITAPRAVEQKTVTVNLGVGSAPSAGSFSLSKGANDNHVISFTKKVTTSESSSAAAPLQLLVFRMEEDAVTTLHAIERTLLGQGCPSRYKIIGCHIYAGLRVLLTVLSIVALLLVLSVIWKGYHSVDAYQRQRASASLQPPAGHVTTPPVSSGVLPSQPQTSQVLPASPTASAPHDAYQIPTPQLGPAPTQVPQPVAQTPAKSTSPADMVISGLNGH